MKDASEAFNDFGIDPEEVVEDRQRKGGPIDRRICLCGHSINKHKSVDTLIPWRDGPTDRHECKPNGGLGCECKGPRPVLLVTDARTFQRVTIGEGGGHALLKGIKNMPKGAKYEWLVPLACDKCGATGREKQVLPVPLTREGKRTFDDKSFGYDRLLCFDCREVL